MKQFFLAVLALVLFSCSGGNRKQAEPAVNSFPDVESLLAVAEQEVDNTITVAGFVTHTCKHSGKKCFIVGESKVSLQVLAGGEIESFSSDLVGSKLAITGVLKEYHLSQEQIDERENNVKQQQKEGASEETCSAELSNISEMRQWMKDRDKDYYVIYYVEGLKYEVLE